MKRDAIVEHDGEAIQCGFPVGYWFGPAFADVAKGQKQELDGGLIGRERAPIFGDLAQRPVHRLNGIGGVDDFANVFGIGENGIICSQCLRHDYEMEG